MAGRRTVVLSPGLNAGFSRGHVMPVLEGKSRLAFRSRICHMRPEAEAEAWGSYAGKLTPILAVVWRGDQT